MVNVHATKGRASSWVGAPTGRAISMKFHAMAGDFEPGPGLGGDPQPVKRGIAEILDLPASQADQVVVQADVGIKAGSIVPIIHLMDEPCPFQDPQGVIHGVGRHLRIPAPDLPVEVFGGGVIDPLGQGLINRRPLRRHLQAPRAKPQACLLLREFHAVPS